MINEKDIATLKAKAILLRSEPTRIDQIMAEALTNKGIRFRSMFVFPPYILSFRIRNFVLEIGESPMYRDNQWSFVRANERRVGAAGLWLLHRSVEEVLENPYEIVNAINERTYIKRSMRNENYSACVVGNMVKELGGNKARTIRHFRYLLRGKYDHYKRIN